jgi:PAS domain S-box-containing protein
MKKEPVKTKIIKTEKTLPAKNFTNTQLKKINAKLQQQVLAKTNELTRFFERITDAFVAFDKNWCYTHMNKKAGEIFQRNPEQMIGKHIWTEFPKGIDQPFYKAYQRAMTEQQYIYLEEYYPPYDLWFENHIYPSAEGLSVFFRDITARKKAAAALDPNTVFIESIINASPDIIYIYDIEDQKNIYVNEGIQSNLGYSDDEIKKMGNQLLSLLMHPADFGYYLYNTYPRYAIAKDKEIITHEYRMKDKGGNWHWLYCKESVFLRKPDKTPKQIFGVTIDITERKKAEEEIKANEEKYRTLVEQASDAIFIADTTGRFITVNTSACKIAQYSEKELLQLSIHNFAVMEDLQREPFHFDELKQGKTVNTERVMKRKDGSVLHVEITAKLLSDGRLLTFVRDISERIKVQNEIIKEKNISDSIINSLPGVFYLYNKERQFLRWNRNFETVTKYSADEIRKLNPLDFFDEGEKELLSQKIDAVFILGEENVEADFLLKTGEKIPYYFTGTAIEYEGNTCLMGVGINISERVKAQKKIKETSEQLRQLTVHLQCVREEERKRIGREIHDELGQQITAIKMDVAWIDKKIPEEKTDLKNKIKNIIQLLDGSHQSIKRILSELRPGILDDYGLLEAIEWLGTQFTANTGIPVKFTTTQTKLKIAEPVATCIFRLCQEALTNITRHAQAGKVLISLSINDDTVTVNIEDDGKGFDTTAVQNKKSFGILGMKERVHSLAGKFKLISSPGKGTGIIISIPGSI